MHATKILPSFFCLSLILFFPLQASAVTPIQLIPLTDTLFVGPTETAPPAPAALHNIADFENHYGTRSPSGPGTTYDLWLAARSFFAQGGETLYIAPLGDTSSPEEYRQAIHRIIPPSPFGLIAAPGYGRLPNAMRIAVASTVINAAEESEYGFAVLEPLLQSSVNELIGERAQYDTRHAALYVPWVEMYNDPIAGIVSTPASGTVVGAIAKSEIDHGANMPPAGMAVNGLSGLTHYFTSDEINLLSTYNIDPIRLFDPSDYKIWGARTLTSGTEMYYINNQRYGSQLELSIRVGTEWVLEESNSEPLWTSLTTQIETFLFGEWQRGALFGSTSGEAYFITCDQSTMTADDIDAGRTICIWGVSLLRPAEFTAFKLTHERNPGPVDNDPPSGYSIHVFTTSEDERTFSLQIENAEMSSSFQYLIGSSGGPKILSGRGDVPANTFPIEISDRRLSSLADGQLSIYFALTDTVGNLGPWVSATTTKPIPDASGIHWPIFLPAILTNTKQ